MRRALGSARRGGRGGARDGGMVCWPAACEHGRRRHVLKGGDKVERPALEERGRRDGHVVGEQMESRSVEVDEHVHLGHGHRKPLVAVGDEGRRARVAAACGSDHHGRIVGANLVDDGAMRARELRHRLSGAHAEALHKGSEGGGRATRGGRGGRRFAELEEVAATRERLEHHERLETLWDAREAASRVPDGDCRARPCRLGLGRLRLGVCAGAGAVGRGCTRQSWRRVGRHGGDAQVG